MLSKNKAKFVRSLQLRKYRQKYHKIVVEGVKIVKDLLLDDLGAVDTIIAVPEWLEENNRLIGAHIEAIECDARDLSSISSLKTPNDVLAVMEMPDHLDQIDIANEQLCLYLDSVRDPGNLGTILRTADWFGIRHVYMSTDCVDVYNPKVIQSSMSSVLRVKVGYVEQTTLLENEALHIIATALEGEPLNNDNRPQRGILVMGNESKGVNPDLIRRANQLISIPGDRRLGAESLNVAVATGIVLSKIYAGKNE